MLWYRRQASGGRGHSILVIRPNKEDHARKFVGIKVLHQIGATQGNIGAHTEASWSKHGLLVVPEIYRIMSKEVDGTGLSDH